MGDGSDSDSEEYVAAEVEVSAENASGLRPKTIRPRNTARMNVQRNILISHLWDDDSSTSSPGESRRVSWADEPESRSYAKQNIVTQSIILSDLWDDCSTIRAEKPSREVSLPGKPESRNYLEQSVLVDSLWHSPREMKKSAADEPSWNFLAGIAVGGAACWILLKR